MNSLPIPRLHWISRELTFGTSPKQSEEHSRIVVKSFNEFASENFSGCSMQDFLENVRPLLNWSRMKGLGICEVECEYPCKVTISDGMGNKYAVLFSANNNIVGVCYG